MIRPEAAGRPPPASPPSTSAGRVRPPPTPWTTRNAIRLSALHARLASTDPTRNTARAIIHSRLLPRTRCAQPAIGIVTPSASRYARADPLDRGDRSLQLVRQAVQSDRDDRGVEQHRHSADEHRPRRPPHGRVDHVGIGLRDGPSPHSLETFCTLNARASNLGNTMSLIEGRYGASAASRCGVGERVCSTPPGTSSVDKGYSAFTIESVAERAQHQPRRHLPPLAHQARARAAPPSVTPAGRTGSRSPTPARSAATSSSCCDAPTDRAPRSPS